MGENKNSIFNIGSPDIDIILKKKKQISSMLKKDIQLILAIMLFYYGIQLHLKQTPLKKIQLSFKFFGKLNRNCIIIYPNNDPGSNYILNVYSKIKNKKFKILKSLRFESFLTLLKNSEFIIEIQVQQYMKLQCSIFHQ